MIVWLLIALSVGLNIATGIVLVLVRRELRRLREIEAMRAYKIYTSGLIARDVQ